MIELIWLMEVIVWWMLDEEKGQGHAKGPFLYQQHSMALAPP
jgi:hypothetical protein